MTDGGSRVGSVCVFCGSSNEADARHLQAAADFGGILARSGVRLVYGGGGVGLMGACARAAHTGGGQVLGVMPAFLQSRESLYDAVETVVVDTMHQRKHRMFDEADAFAILPGGIGTLEEVIEVLSWSRLGLHNKPVVFLSPDGFWDPLFQLLAHTARHRLTPQGFLETYGSVERVEDLLPEIERWVRGAGVQQEEAAKTLM
jgi:uncharacterized protein (TIGR00730 family)